MYNSRVGKPLHKAQRLLALRELLREPRHINALAARFKVSPRTIEWDLAELDVFGTRALRLSREERKALGLSGVAWYVLEAAE